MTLTGPIQIPKPEAGGPVAQLAEQWTLNPEVEGSIPSGPTTSCSAPPMGPRFTWSRTFFYGKHLRAIATATSQS
jgi:hypothetical protein